MFFELPKLSKKNIGKSTIGAADASPHCIGQSTKCRQWLLSSFVITMFSLSPLVVAGEAYAGSSQISAQIGITAVVREYTSLRVLSQTQELTITSADIERGYVEAPAAARISVRSNNPAGYLLAFESRNSTDYLSAVNVRAGGGETQLPSNGAGWLPQPYVPGGVTQDVTCRFILSRDARPGTYLWPLTISAVSR